MELNKFMSTQAPPPLTDPEPEREVPSPGADALAELPEWRIPEGTRNTTMSKIAGYLIKRYGNTDEAKKLFVEKAKACAPPLSRDELKGIWKSAVKFGKKVAAQEGYIPPEEYNDRTPRKPEDYSDVGQAYAFAKHCRSYVRYSPATDYIVYDGTCWQESKPRSQAAMQQCTDAQLREAGKETERTEEWMESFGAKAVLDEFGSSVAMRLTDEQTAAIYAHQGAQTYKKFVLQRRDSKYRVAALREARPMVENDQRDLDAYPFLLNTSDYTVDLRKGLDGKQLYRAEDFITKCTTIVPGEEGANLWLDALQTFFCGDAEFEAYVQQIVGLAVIGHVYIEALIIAHGDGRNGKSTFWNVLARLRQGGHCALLGELRRDPPGPLITLLISPFLHIRSRAVPRERKSQRL